MKTEDKIKDLIIDALAKRTRLVSSFLETKITSMEISQAILH